MNIRTRRGLALLAMATLVATAACSRDEAATADALSAEVTQPVAAVPDAAPPAGVEEDADAEEAFDSNDPTLARHVQLIRLGASMQALAETCDVEYDRAELASAKQQQRESLKAQGVSERDFNAAYKAAYDEGIAKLEAAGVAGRAEACAQMKQFEQMGRALQQP